MNATRTMLYRKKEREMGKRRDIVWHLIFVLSFMNKLTLSSLRVKMQPQLVKNAASLRFGGRLHRPRDSREVQLAVTSRQRLFVELWGVG